MYPSASNHLFRCSFLLVYLVGVCQIIGQDTGIAVVSSSCIFISGQVLGDAVGWNPGLKVLAESCSLFQVYFLGESFGFGTNMLQSVQPGEFEFVEALFLSNLSNSLSVCPDIVIWDTQDVWKYS